MWLQSAQLYLCQTLKLFESCLPITLAFFPISYRVVKFSKLTNSIYSIVKKNEVITLKPFMKIYKRLILLSQGPLWWLIFEIIFNKYHWKFTPRYQFFEKAKLHYMIFFFAIFFTTLGVFLFQYPKTEKFGFFLFYHFNFTSYLTGILNSPNRG